MKAFLSIVVLVIFVDKGSNNDVVAKSMDIQAHKVDHSRNRIKISAISLQENILLSWNSSVAESRLTTHMRFIGKKWESCERSKEEGE